MKNNISSIYVCQSSVQKDINKLFVEVMKFFYLFFLKLVGASKKTHIFFRELFFQKPNLEMMLRESRFFPIIIIFSHLSRFDKCFIMISLSLLFFVFMIREFCYKLFFSFFEGDARNLRITKMIRFFQIIFRIGTVEQLNSNFRLRQKIDSFFQHTSISSATTKLASF